MNTQGDGLAYSLPPQRINILQQLLQQEVESLAMGSCAPLHGGAALDMTELQPPMAEISRTLNAPDHNSGASLLGLSKHSGVTEPLLAEECEEPQPHLAEKHGEPQACPREETKVAQPHSTTELKPPVPPRAELEPPEPFLPALSGPPLPSCRAQTEPPEACPRTELGACGVSYAVEAGTPESSPQFCCSQGPPATTSLIFSSQSPVCASPQLHSLHSLRSPTGHSGKEGAGKGHEEKALSLWEWALPCTRPSHAFFPVFLSGCACGGGGEGGGSTRKKYNSSGPL